MADVAADSVTAVVSSPPSSSATGTGVESKTALQLKRLQEANAKYKKLLQLAKERIQQQEEELQTVQDENARLKDRSSNYKRDGESNAAEELTAASDEVVTVNIVQVCRRLKQTVDAKRGLEEIWALLEMEAVPLNDLAETTVTKRYKEWKRFDTETQLEDFIRRDTGEPLLLPPYSLSPEQSAKMQSEADTQVSQITEEFRRFRVRAELARKQAESQIRDLQNNKVTNAAQRIEGHDWQHELEQARSMGNELERLKAELAGQEAHWREAYEVLLSENQALKSSGSEALLASQWRHRYEVCFKEKIELESRLQASARPAESEEDKWEAKYRDLKESFRIYRKKAKEIFETQGQCGIVAPPGMATFTLHDQSSAEAKLAYLKNLMVNFLSSSDDVKEQMETAIATVLKFTPGDLEKIQKQKAGNEAWFSIY